MSKDKFIYLALDTLEDCFEVIRVSMAEHFQSSDKPIVICLDSVAGTSTNAELKALAEGSEPARGLHARIISRELRSLGTIMYGRPVVLLFTNQLKSIMNSNPYGPQMDSFGGKGLKYHSRVRIQIDRKSELKSKKFPDAIPHGIRCKAKVIKNKIAQPFRTAEFDINFKSGIEEYYPVIFFLADKGAIPKYGNKLSWNSKSYFESQLYELFKESPEDWMLARKLFIEVYTAFCDNREPTGEVD